MSIDWAPQFCLGCDCETHEGQGPYCSQSCRLADFERQTAPSTPSSVSELQAYLMSTTSRQTTMGRYGSASSPASPTRSPMPCPATKDSYAYQPAQRSLRMPFHEAASPYMAHSHHGLSTSASHTSLSSLNSAASSASSTSSWASISTKAARELREYARSFESVKAQRRRSAQ